MKALRDRTFALVRHGYLFSDLLDKDDTTPGVSDPDPAAGPAFPGAARPRGGRALLRPGPGGRTPRPAGAVAHSLFGKGAVNGLDGAEHRHRKQLFLDVTSPVLVADLAARVGDKWQAELDRWIRSRRGTVLPSAVRAIGEAAQEWAGVPDASIVMQRRARDLVQIVDGFGRLGLPHLRSRWPGDGPTPGPPR